MIYAAPGTNGAKIQFQSKYDNFIGGKWVAPVKGGYFDVITPITGSGVYESRAFHLGGCRTCARRGSRGLREMGTHVGWRARQCAT